MANLKLEPLLSELAAAADPVRAKSSAWFFKTGKGEYGEGDQFIGIAVPLLRKIARRHRDLPQPAIKKLLASKIHEHRFVALEVLVAQFESASPREQTAIYDFFLANTARIDNWDLVDTSARDVVGAYLLNRPRSILRKLAKSSSIWERRIAIVSTFAFIRMGETAETFAIAQLLLGDDHDLIHKAVGWALREAGKQTPKELVDFLRTHYDLLPRTTLRYAIERFTPVERKCFLAGNFTAV